MKRLWLVVAILAVFVLIAGCGGGGGGGSDPSIHGKANISSLSEHPKIAILDLYNGSWVTLSCSSLSRPSSGRHDVGFRVDLPDWESYAVYTVVVFNDYNHNNTYDNWNNEVLGFMDHFVETDSARDEWFIAEGGHIYYSDATKADLYIYCPFDRALNDQDAAMQEKVKAERAARGVPSSAVNARVVLENKTESNPDGAMQQKAKAERLQQEQ